MKCKDTVAAGTALKIVFSYLILAGVGLLLLPWLNNNSASSWIPPIHFLHDTLFLLLTSGPLFFLIYRFAAQQNSLRKSASHNETRYHSLFDNMCKGGVLYQPVNQGQDFTLIDINFIGEQIDKINRREYIGRRLSELSQDTISTELSDGIRRVHTTGNPEHISTTTHRRHHRKQYKDNYIFSLDSGEIVVVYDDITEKKNLEKELKHSKAKLTLQNRIITQFLTINDDDVYQQVLHFNHRKS